ESGAPEGTVVIASSQSKGKGRMGRKWISPKNGGLYLSVILRPPADINEVPSLTLVAALSVSRAIKALTGLDAGIKWPNDILLNGKKVCGILTEMKAQPDKVDFLVLGIGLNVDTWQKDLPDEAVSLREVTGEKVGLTRTAKCLLEEMEKDYFTFKKDGFSGLRNECRKLSLVLDRVVEVSHHGKRIKGTAIDLDEAGALIVRTEEDQRVRILSGDVVL
ncbi:MAG: biotin--[acetyl-CoA-carboxylase] ligase, partial [Candidatus Omnitrophica bacterium]|nr:biotin--[acetyl-CoA-carboxylase] ligase [Candidatus Omnitrophota bacterium]